MRYHKRQSPRKPTIVPWGLYESTMKAEPSTIFHFFYLLMEGFTNLHGKFHGSKFTSMEAILLPWKLPWKSVSVDLLSWKFPWKLVGVDLLPCKLVEASMEIHGSFHCRWKWKLPLLPSIAASTNIFRGSFHELPCTPTYFHLLPRVS